MDTVLDTMRAITAKLGPGQPLSLHDQQQLANVYLKLESHLIEHDPLRSFSQQTLRNDVQNHFPTHKPDEAAFWEMMTARH
ncbi:MAG TPA: hypothetical protein VFZ58_04835 [Candidatus Saccharimonadales bacterium]